MNNTVYRVNAIQCFLICSMRETGFNVRLYFDNLRFVWIVCNNNVRWGGGLPEIEINRIKLWFKRFATIFD